MAVDIRHRCRRAKYVGWSAICNAFCLGVLYHIFPSCEWTGDPCRIQCYLGATWVSSSTGITFCPTF